MCLFIIIMFVCLFVFFSGWQNLPITKKLQYVTDKIVATLLSSCGIPLKNKTIHATPSPLHSKGCYIFCCFDHSYTCTGSLNIHMFKVCRYKHWDIGDMFWPHDILWNLKLKSKYLEEKPLCLVAMAANFLDLNEPYGRNRHMVRTIFRQT